MENTYFAVSLFLACVALGGCQQPHEWYLTASKQGEGVQLCLSNEVKCPQPDGVSPSGISVYRYDSTFDNELVWDVEPDNPITDARIRGLVTFGTPPANWSNKKGPPPLICGKAYLVNPGAHYFALKCDGSVVVFDSPDLETFFRKENPPEPAKKRPG